MQAVWHAVGHLDLGHRYGGEGLSVPDDDVGVLRREIGRVGEVPTVELGVTAPDRGSGDGSKPGMVRWNSSWWRTTFSDEKRTIISTKATRASTGSSSSGSASAAARSPDSSFDRQPTS